MTTTVSVHRICDRCAHVYDESHHKYGETLPTYPKRCISASISEGADAKSLFIFNDLCPECVRVVDGLIGRIRLSDSEEKPVKKPKKEKAPVAAVAESAAEVGTQLSLVPVPPEPEKDPNSVASPAGDPPF